MTNKQDIRRIVFNDRGQSVMLVNDAHGIYVCLDYSHYPSNQGGCFDRNWRETDVTVEFYYEIKGVKIIVLDKVVVGAARVSNDASKVAREYFKKNGLRKQQKELMKKLIKENE